MSTKIKQKHVRFNALLMQRLIVQQIHKHKQKVKWTVMKINIHKPK